MGFDRDHDMHLVLITTTATLLCMQRALLVRHIDAMLGCLGPFCLSFYV